MEASDGPDDATGREVEQGLGSFTVEGRTSDQHDGVTEPSGCSYSRVAPKPPRLASQYTRKRARVVGNGAPVQV